MLDVKEESRRPVSLGDVFEVVEDDLQALNQNLRSVSTKLPLDSFHKVWGLESFVISHYRSVLLLCV